MQCFRIANADPTSDPRPPADPHPPIEPECECQDSERCPVHHGYD
jgi:hypothetical protein